MLKRLELDRDGPPDLVFQKESPYDMREHHSQFAQLPHQASAHARESLTRDHLSRAQKEHQWSSAALTHTNVVSTWLQSARYPKWLRELLKPMNGRPHPRNATSGSLGHHGVPSSNLRCSLLGRSFQWSPSCSGEVFGGRFITWGISAPEGVVPRFCTVPAKVLVRGEFIVC
jgi:hypothetical protein